jgi:hypothetical protein
VQGLVPSDITIRHNTLAKPLAWKPDEPSYAGDHFTVKNLLELKNARRVAIEGNLFERCWADGQSGEAAVLTVRNQNGTAPWSTVETVRFADNLVRRVGGGLSILGHDDHQPSQEAHDFTIENNLFYDLGGAWGGDGRLAVLASGTGEPGPSAVRIEHNTALQSGDPLVSSTPGTVVEHPGLRFADNIALGGSRGVWGDGTAAGDPSLAAYYPDAAFSGNVLVGAPAAAYAAHPGNWFPPTVAEVGFVDPAGSDYRLTSGSPYLGRGADLSPRWLRQIAAPQPAGPKHNARNHTVFKSKSNRMGGANQVSCQAGTRAV